MTAPRACILLLLAAAAACAGGGAPSAAPQAVDLLRAYEPILLFHPEEDWAPERPEAFLADARLERQVARGSWSAVPGPLPTSTAGCAFNPCFRLNLPCALRLGDACYERLALRKTQWQRPVVFGRVVNVPAGSAPAPGFTAPPRYLVRYWLFYEFDDWHSARKRLWQAHEGDWESISVAIGADGLPQFAAYSQHCSGSIRGWSSVQKRGQTHPVAYVALGSHANYFTNTSSSTRFTECLGKGLATTAAAKAASLVRLAQDRVVDRTGLAHPLGPPSLAGVSLAGVTPLELVALDPAALPWAGFAGRWSEGQLLWLGTVPHPLTSVSQGYGPSTPRWTSTSIPSLWHVESS
ncbi:MAG: hypothetical protein M3P41_15690 [Actinomycetota bacterium]|nr:hypothetical protein [Actinomycetota bacterium]